MTADSTKNNPGSLHVAAAAPPNGEEPMNRTPDRLAAASPYAQAANAALAHHAPGLRRADTMATNQTQPTSARGLTLIVDGETLAYAQTCSVQYYTSEESILQPDWETHDDPVWPLRRLLDVARLLAGGGDHSGGKPAVTAHYVRKSGNSTFEDTPYSHDGEWPDSQDLEGIGFINHVVGQKIGSAWINGVPQNAAELIPILAETEAGANDILVVSQADQRGSLTAELRDLQTLADGSTRRVMAACFTRLAERFGRSSSKGCARRPVKQGGVTIIPNGQEQFHWEFVCCCEQAAQIEPYANAEIEVFDLIHDFGLPFVYGADFDDLQCTCDGQYDPDEGTYPCEACYVGGPDYSCWPALLDEREQTSAAFLERLQHRAPPNPTTPAMPKRTTPRPSPRTDRPLIGLIDFENIDGAVHGFVGSENLGPETRPDFLRVADFFRDRAGAGKVEVYGFLQDNGRNSGFANFLERECGFRVEVLIPESKGADCPRPRSVVDEAIINVLENLEERDCDVILMSHDGDYFETLECLHNRGVNRDRSFGVCGFPEKMSALYREANWIKKIDLEHDVGAFQNPLPNRRRAIAVDDLDVTRALGGLGLDSLDGPDAT